MLLGGMFILVVLTSFVDASLASSYQESNQSERRIQVERGENPFIVLNNIESTPSNVHTVLLTDEFLLEFNRGDNTFHVSLQIPSHFNTDNEITLRISNTISNIRNFYKSSELDHIVKIKIDYYYHVYTEHIHSKTIFYSGVYTDILIAPCNHQFKNLWIPKTDTTNPIYQLEYDLLRAFRNRVDVDIQDQTEEELQSYLKTHPGIARQFYAINSIEPNRRQQLHAIFQFPHNEDLNIDRFRSHSLTLMNPWVGEPWNVANQDELIALFKHVILQSYNIDEESQRNLFFILNTYIGQFQTMPPLPFQHQLDLYNIMVFLNIEKNDRKELITNVIQRNSQIPINTMLQHLSYDACDEVVRTLLDVGFNFPAEWITNPTIREMIEPPLLQTHSHFITVADSTTLQYMVQTGMVGNIYAILRHHEDLFHVGLYDVAVQSNQLESLKILIHIRNLVDLPLLDLSIHLNRVDIAMYLFNLMRSNDNGDRTKELFFNSNSVEMLKAFVENRGDINLYDKKGNNIIHHLCSRPINSNTIQMIAFAIEHEVSPTAINFDGYTPIDRKRHHLHVSETELHLFNRLWTPPTPYHRLSFLLHPLSHR